MAGVRDCDIASPRYCTHSLVLYFEVVVLQSVGNPDLTEAAALSQIITRLTCATISEYCDHND